MARRGMISFFLIGIFGFTYLGYHHWSKNRAMATGDVFPDPRDRSAVPARTQPASPIVYPPAKSSVAALPAAAGQMPLPPQGQRVAPAAPSKTAAGLAADTISPNPPNGMVFAGSGRFQVHVKEVRLSLVTVKGKPPRVLQLSRVTLRSSLSS